RPPVPSAELLAAVRRYLEPRRPLTTELHVVAPTYVAVTVTATLHVTRPDPGLAGAAQAALDAFFDPLTGGPDGTGGPFGRGLLESDLMHILGGLRGVRYVDGVSIAVDHGTARCENVVLCPTELVASGAHHFSVVEGQP